MVANPPSSSTLTNESPAEIETKFAELKALIDGPGSPREFLGATEVESLFRNCLMDNVREGVVFVDQQREISAWNRGAELITGLVASSMLGCEFTPEILGLCGSDGQPLTRVNCPVAKAITTKKQTAGELLLTGRSGREVSVELLAIPVIRENSCHGAALLLHDLSTNAELRRQLNDLYSISVLDPLTRVANRAEFEKSLKEYVAAHRATDSKCGLIVCDIDYFKQVNDQYGHHIGDQALISFAQMLRNFVRARDVVARYGGEEFVILCANCDLESAVERAEQIRMSLNKSPQQMLNGKTLSASFGVAELKPHENTTDFFIRADKALLTAKKLGRNRVIQATDRVEEEPEAAAPEEVSVATGIPWQTLADGYLCSEEFCTRSPASMLTSKIRGYISETQSQIRKSDTDFVSMTVPAVDPTNSSRRSNFRVDVETFETTDPVEKRAVTYIRITVYPPRPRLFRKTHVDLHARVIAQLRNYLMLSDETACVKLNPAATDSGREES